MKVGLSSSTFLEEGVEGTKVEEEDHPMVPQGQPMVPLNLLMELQSHHMELQNLPMEHLLRPMDLQSPHMKPPNRPTKHPSHLMAHQLQCMRLHLPSTGARPMEPRQPQWCKLPMSGGREQEIILSLDKSVGKEKLA